MTDAGLIRRLLEGVTDLAIIALDASGCVATWTPGAQRLHGYAADEITGRHVSCLYPRPDAESGTCASHLETASNDGRFACEGWRVRKDGPVFWAEVMISALHDDGGSLVGFAQVTRDITERRNGEERRLRLAEEQAANRAKDALLATVSEELRRPLRTILGWSTILAQRTHDPSTARGLEAIQRNAETQVQLVDELLDAMRIVTGKLRIEPRALDLAAIVRDVLDTIAPAAAAKGIAVSVERLDDPVLLVGDAARLQQVTWNLLSNAVKFSEAGGEVRVRLHQDGPSVCLEVQDAGRGIAHERLVHVFERFRQAEADTTTEGDLGLGLSIVRHVVELHGGRVTAESAGLGRGATFRVKLPVRAIAPTHADAKTPSERLRVARSHRLDGVRVLVVDDEEDARELVKAVLTAHGASVETADSAGAARAVLPRLRPHVVVSDLGMPDEDGYQLLRALRALPMQDVAGIPAIALSAYARPDNRRRALAAGYDRHVAKPVDPEDLVEIVRAVASPAK